MQFSFKLDNPSEVKVCVIGAGEVGLRVCELFGDAGYSIHVVDIDQKKIELLKNGISPIREDGLSGSIAKLFAEKRFLASLSIAETVPKCNVVIVAVSTPICGENANLSPIKACAEDVGKVLSRGTLVVVESSTYPGVTEEVLQPRFEKNGMKARVDFGLVQCPERVDPGNIKFKIRNIARVIGASDEESLSVAKRFYESAIDAEIFPVSNIKTAEAIKLVENTFRDVNIAYANELAKLFDGTEVSITEVLAGASTKPFAFMAHYPGPGVGGECIPVSPRWLGEFAAKHGRELALVKTARAINDGMASYVAKKLKKKMGEKKRVLVLGLAYKEDVASTKISPSKKLIEELKREKFEVYAHDPLISNEQATSEFGVEWKEVENADVDAYVLACAHKQYKEGLMKIDFKGKILFDTKNVFAGKESELKNADYVGLGR
ncbi:MAG: nucleotide sugar dehydrogenase [Candidatus Micrarchaeota archaeon]